MSAAFWVRKGEDLDVPVFENSQVRYDDDNTPRETAQYERRHFYVHDGRESPRVFDFPDHIDATPDRHIVRHSSPFSAAPSYLQDRLPGYVGFADKLLEPLDQTPQSSPRIVPACRSPSPRLDKWSDGSAFKSLYGEPLQPLNPKDQFYFAPPRPLTPNTYRPDVRSQADTSDGTSKAGHHGGFFRPSPVTSVSCPQDLPTQCTQQQPLCYMRWRNEREDQLFALAFSRATPPPDPFREPPREPPREPTREPTREPLREPPREQPREWSYDQMRDHLRDRLRDQVRRGQGTQHPYTKQHGAYDTASHSDTATVTLLKDAEAADLARRSLDIFKRRQSRSSRYARVLMGLIQPKGHDFKLDASALEAIFVSTNEIFFNGRLSHRVRWCWSDASSSDDYNDNLIGHTSLRQAQDGGFETLILLSTPILTNPKYSRRLLISAFIHELIHCYLFICCGWDARESGGHTDGFHKIANMIDDWAGRENLHLCRVEADLERFRQVPVPSQFQGRPSYTTHTTHTTQ